MDKIFIHRLFREHLNILWIPVYSTIAKNIRQFQLSHSFVKTHCEKSQHVNLDLSIIHGIPFSGKLSREKTFADRQEVTISQGKFSWMLKPIS